MRILVLNGPNMNLLGIREPELYGKATYETLVGMIRTEAARLGAEAECVQSNHEGALVDAIQGAYFDGADGVILNPAAYTHTSVALLDALKATGLRAVEVHVTDPDEREEFRRVSYVREAAIATIKGHGLEGYLEALRLLCGACGDGVTYRMDGEGVLTVWGKGPMRDFDSFREMIFPPWSEEREGITRVTLERGVTSVGACAFLDCKRMTGVTIPEGVTKIGWYAFGGCRNLTGVTIPDSVVEIGYRAFHDTGLTRVSIPAGAKADACAFPNWMEVERRGA